MLRKLLGGLFRKDRPLTLPASWPPGQPHLSVIICSIDEERYARVSANLAQRLARWPHELICIPDARSLAEGYNRGMDRARGEWLVFCHDDIEMLQADFDHRLLAHMASHDVLGVAGATRLRNGTWIGAGEPDLHGQVLHPVKDEEGGGCMLSLFCSNRHEGRPAIQVLDGLFMAARASVARALRFDEQTFDGFHLYDVDFSFRAHREGYRVGVCHDILIYHQSYGMLDEAWTRYCRIFEQKFDGQLSSEPAGPMRYRQVPVRDTAEALAAFTQVIEGTVVLRP